MRAFSIPIPMTSGLRSNAAIRIGAKINTIMPISSAQMIVTSIPKRAPFFVRSYCFAPRFCPTKVVSAIVKLVIGRKPNPSIFEYAPQPAIATSPKELIFDCTTTFANAIIEFCTPDGRPTLIICQSSLPWKRILLIYSLYGSLVNISRRRQSSALANCEITVAIAAPPTPELNTAMNTRSSTRLTTDDTMR